MIPITLGKGYCNVITSSDKIRSNNNNTRVASSSDHSLGNVYNNLFSFISTFTCAQYPITKEQLFMLYKRK